MSKSLFLTGGLLLATVASPGQTAPTAFTVTEVLGFFGPPVKMIVYRSGSKAAIDHPDSPAGPTRGVLNLNDHTNYSWAINDPGNGCSNGKWGGDWGDPFTGLEPLGVDLKKTPSKQVGTGTVAARSAKIFEIATDDGTAKYWLDDKLPLILRLVATNKAGKSENLIEILEVNLTPPPDSVFVLPAICAATPKYQSDDERIAALTGGKASDFSMGTHGPTSPEKCSAYIRIVKAGSMTPITSGFEIAVDLAISPLHPPGHTVGISADGHSTFQGGGIRDMTNRLKDGVLWLGGSAAPLFDVEVVFDHGRGAASAVVYRQCSGPQLTLLMVVKNPDKLSDGVEWLWDKQGKYLPATH